MSDILLVIDIHAKPEVVYDTVATVEGIRRWWSSDVEGSDEIGGSVTIRFGSQWKVVMERTASEDKKSVSYRITRHDSDEWLGTELVFKLSTVDGWTILSFDQRGWPTASSFFRFCSAKWTVFLLSIKQAAELGIGTPYPNETKIGRMD